jgi:23S rRNA pseudouridine1911/1915/1917 synthase
MQGSDFDVDARAAGERLDTFLASRLALSRAEVRRILARGVVRLDGRAIDAAAKGERLLLGARVEVASFLPREDQRVIPEPELGLKVLAEGDGWLVLDKPAGMPVHPHDEDERGTAAGLVAALHPEMHGVGEGGLRSGVVHRLDVDTSGALAFTWREEAWARLRRAFRKHRVAKTYRAIVLGDAVSDAGRSEVGLRVAQHRPARVAVVEASRAAEDRSVRVGRLEWQVLERFAAGALVEVALETGFLHQVRATLAHLGAPIAGDRTYGPAAAAGEDPSGAQRQMLHAARLHFEELSAEAPDPDDFRALLDQLRG